MDRKVLVGLFHWTLSFGIYRNRCLAKDTTEAQATLEDDFAAVVGRGKTSVPGADTFDPTEGVRARCENFSALEVFRCVRPLARLYAQLPTPLWGVRCEPQPLRGFVAAVLSSRCSKAVPVPMGARSDRQACGVAHTHALQEQQITLACQRSS